MIIQNQSSRTSLSVAVFICFILSCGVFGCQTPGPNSGKPFFPSPVLSPPATIPPPATGSYKVSDALAYTAPSSASPIQPSSASVGSSGNDFGKDSRSVEPFRSSETASSTPPLVPTIADSSQDTSGQWSASAQPFQTKNADIPAGSVAPGSALTAANVGDRIEIPPSAFRTESGMRISSEAAFANTRGSSSVTQTAFVAPAATRLQPDSSSQPGPVAPGPIYAEKHE